MYKVGDIVYYNGNCSWYTALKRGEKCKVTVSDKNGTTVDSLDRPQICPQTVSTNSLDLPLDTADKAEPRLCDCRGHYVDEDIDVSIRSILANKQKRVLTVVFGDGTTELVHWSKEDTFDARVGTALAISRHIYGSNNAFRKVVDERLKTIEVTKKKGKK